MRRRLPSGVRMYTGDDFNYAELIAGDEQGYSRRAARHLRRDRAGGLGGAGRARRRTTRKAFHDILAPTVPLSRHIFAAPTRFYKTGVVFMAWLNGHQDHFTMVGGQESARSIAASRRDVPPRRRGRSAARSRARASRACGACWRCAASSLTDARLLRRSSLALSLNTATVRKQGDLVAIVEAARGTASARSRPGATRSRHVGLDRAVTAVRDAGLALSGYCRGGMFPADAAHRQAARDDNRRAVDEAAALGAPCLVLVVGGLPQYSRPGSAASKDSPARAQAW